MKKFAFVLVACCWVVLSQAQSTDTISKATLTAVCDCITNSSADINDETDLQRIMIQCIMNGAASELLEKVAENPELAQGLGVKLGMGLMKLPCPAMVNLSVRLAAAKKGAAVAPNVKSGTGTVTSVAERDFLYVTVKLDNDREQEFMYQQYVPGSESWLKSSSTLRGKKVNISWNEQEVYSPRTKDYKTVKVIRALQVN